MAPPLVGWLGAWVPCKGGCGEYWCKLHDMHAFECACPPIEEWTVNPYGEETSRNAREGRGEQR